MLHVRYAAALACFGLFFACTAHAATAPATPTLQVTAYPDAFDESLADVKLSWYGSTGAQGYNVYVAQYPSGAGAWGFDVGYTSSFEAELAYGTELLLAVTAYVKDAHGNSVESDLSNIVVLRLLSKTEILVEAFVMPAGDDDDDDTPGATGLNGNWLVTETLDLSALGQGTVTESYQLAITVSGSTVTLHSPLVGASLSGSVSGDQNSGTVSGSTVVNGMTIAATGSFNVNGDSLSGSGSYKLSIAGQHIATIPATFTGTRQ